MLVCFFFFNHSLKGRINNLITHYENTKKGGMHTGQNMKMVSYVSLQRIRNAWEKIHLEKFKGDII